jgi:hypothetical protein
MGMTDVEKRALKGGIAFIEPKAAAIPDACRASGMSRSEIYRRAHLASLPAATFRAPKSAA